MRKSVYLFILFAMVIQSGAAVAEDVEPLNGAGIENEMEYDPFEDDKDIREYKGISDPLEPWNRLVFAFNDRFYFWAYKPVARGYKRLIPKGGRIAVRNLFRNLIMPVRLVNTCLQGKMKGAGVELVRFGINTTIGVLGLFDFAKRHYDLQWHDEDLGQTLGFYGLGNGFYIIWPFLGPSSVRDTIGFAGDGFLDPLPYIFNSEVQFTITAYKYLNDNSLRLGDYEDFKEDAIEPYIALRSAYFQHREDKIKK